MGKVLVQLTLLCFNVYMDRGCQSLEAPSFTTVPVNFTVPGGVKLRVLPIVHVTYKVCIDDCLQLMGCVLRVLY